MKRKNIIMVSIVVAAMGLIPACNLVDECGTCEYVTEYSDGRDTEYGTPLPFCGDDLKDKENAPPVVIGPATSYWNCY